MIKDYICFEPKKTNMISEIKKGINGPNANNMAKLLGITEFMYSFQEKPSNNSLVNENDFLQKPISFDGESGMYSINTWSIARTLLLRSEEQSKQLTKESINQILFFFKCDYLNKTRIDFDKTLTHIRSIPLVECTISYDECEECDIDGQVEVSCYLSKSQKHHHFKTNCPICEGSKRTNVVYGKKIEEHKTISILGSDSYYSLNKISKIFENINKYIKPEFDDKEFFVEVKNLSSDKGAKPLSINICNVIEVVVLNVITYPQDYNFNSNFAILNP